MTGVDNQVLVHWRVRERGALRERSGLTASSSSGPIARGRSPSRRSPRVCRGACSTSAAARATSRERIVTELGAEVVAIDLSPRMVELARERGSTRSSATSRSCLSPTASSTASRRLDALPRAGPRQAHRRVCARARPGGRLVAVDELSRTTSPRCGICSRRRAAGRVRLRPRERRRAARTATSRASSSTTSPATSPFADADGRCRTYVAATDRLARHLAPHVPEHRRAVRGARRSHVVFVAEQGTRDLRRGADPAQARRRRARRGRARRARARLHARRGARLPDGGVPDGRLLPRACPRPRRSRSPTR